MTRETMWEGRFLTVRKEGAWEYAERQGSIAAAVILATDPDGRLLLVEQHRVPIGRRCIELPAGLIGDDTDGEAVLDGAGRELEEETGYRAGRLVDCGLFYSSPGMTSESFTIVRATDLVRVGEGGGVEGEGITVHHVAPVDVPRFVAEQRAAGLGIDAKILLLLDAVTVATAAG